MCLDVYDYHHSQGTPLKPLCYLFIAYASFHPQHLATTGLISSPRVFLFENVIKWTLTVRHLQKLGSFTQHEALGVHPSCCVYK